MEARGYDGELKMIEELYELMSNVASYMDDDYEEAYEYVTQFGPIDKKRILALDLPR